MGEAEITPKKHAQWVWLNLDDDGTPLNMRGERMVKISPGEWADPLVACMLDYVTAHPLTED